MISYDSKTYLQLCAIALARSRRAAARLDLVRSRRATARLDGAAGRRRKTLPAPRVPWKRLVRGVTSECPEAEFHAALRAPLLRQHLNTVVDGFVYLETAAAAPRNDLLRPGGPEL